MSGPLVLDAEAFSALLVDLLPATSKFEIGGHSPGRPNEVSGLRPVHPAGDVGAMPILTLTLRDEMVT